MAMQIYTGQEAQDQERVKLLGNYSPKDHLVMIQTKQGQKQYYPAAWRLYELSLRYPNANFSSEILYHNIETGDIVVCARLYLSASYELSEKKAEAMKYGKLANLDKVETAAKARAARDFGIGTEMALDFEEVNDVEVVSTVARSLVVETEPQVVESQPRQLPEQKAQKPAAYPNEKAVGALKNEVLKAGIASTKQEWMTWKCQVLGAVVKDGELTEDHIARLQQAIEHVTAVGA